MSGPIDIKILVSMLADRIEQFCAEKLPGGTVDHSGDYVVRNPMRDDHTPGSFKIRVRGEKIGIWKDFATGDGGDALDLVTYLGFDGEKKHAVSWAKSWLGLEDADPAEFRRRKIQADQARIRRKQEQIRKAEKRRRQAQAIYLSAQEDIRGTPVERYLSLERGLDVARLPRPPRALRYHPEVYCAETKSARPGMVAAVTGPDGAFLATHRTYLKIHRDGRVTKAPLTDAKSTLGLYKGGCIRLWKGDSKKGLFQLPPGSSVTLTEGIEDGLTIVLADPSRFVIVGLSVGAMKSIELPDAVDQVVIARQNDAHESQAESDLTKVVDRFLAQGRRVFHFAPPPEFKDVNDLLRLQRKKEGAA